MLTLGDNFVGLTTTLYNLLSFLNLAEIGIGAAVGYLLYQPIFEKNQNVINEIISVFGYLYRWVGYIILIAGIILSLFLPFIFSDTEFSLAVIYFAYFSFLTSSLIGYFINYRQTLLSADQKNYIITAYFQSTYVIKTIIQMVVVHYTRNYYAWILIELCFGFIYSFILNHKINKVYPWLKSEIESGRQLLKKYPQVLKITKQVFVHKIATLLQFRATPFLVYAFVSLETVAFYTNYTIITEKLKSLIVSFLGSTFAGVGNLIAEGETAKILKVYWELMSIRFYVTLVCTFSLYYLMPLFIELWIGETYLMSNSILYGVLIIFALNMLRETTDQFISGYGMYNDVWSPIAESVIFLICSVIGGSIWGLEGVLLGSIVSLITIIHIWKPYFLFRDGFKLPVKTYWKEIFKYILLSVVTIIIFDKLHYIINVYPKNLNWVNLIFYSSYIMLFISVLLLISFYLGTQGMKDFTSRVIHILRGKSFGKNKL